MGAENQTLMVVLTPLDTMRPSLITLRKTLASRVRNAELFSGEGTVPEGWLCAGAWRNAVQCAPRASRHSMGLVGLLAVYDRAVLGDDALREVAVAELDVTARLPVVGPGV